MSSIWQKLGIVEAEKPAAPTEAAPAAPATPAPVMQTAVPSAVLSSYPSAAPVATEVPSVLDTNSVEGQIVQAIESNPVYLAYRTFNDAIVSVQQHIPDERTRYNVAAATTKLTFAEVQPSLESWKIVVEAEDVNFQTNFIQPSQANIDMVQAQIEATDAEILEVTKKLGALSEQKNQLMQDKVQREAELSKAKIDFESVLKTIANRYMGLTSKLTQFLGVANV
jgi:hypothetical protein